MSLRCLTLWTLCHRGSICREGDRGECVSGLSYWLTVWWSCCRACKRRCEHTLYRSQNWDSCERCSTGLSSRQSRRGLADRWRALSPHPSIWRMRPELAIKRRVLPLRLSQKLIQFSKRRPNYRLCCHAWLIKHWLKGEGVQWGWRVFNVPSCGSEICTSADW